jgi:hypothetical protein
MNKIYNSYKLNGTISWTTFETNQELHKNKVIHVTNDDFKYGTLIVSQPCAIKFTENIVFNPDNGDSSNLWFEPHHSIKSTRYANNAFRLGFFAAITIITQNVIIDLNEKKIEQSTRHYLLQRFYAHIELADQPFIQGQGPAEFGNIVESAKFCQIMNGTFGLSSHHAIHGNNNKYIYIYDIVIKKFEVAGIALNNIEALKITDCTIDGEFTNIPILGIFSSAVFLREFAKMSIDASGISAANDLTIKFNNLETAINDVVSDVITNGIIDNTRDSTKIFINESGLSDGASYGILINKKGVAIGAFSNTRPGQYESKNIKIKNVSIKNIIGKTKEIIALSGGGLNTGAIYRNSNIQVDTTGSVFQILPVLDDLTELYVGNVVSELQIAIARWSDSNLSGYDQALYALRQAGRYGVLSIKPAIIAWARNDVSFIVDTYVINNLTTFSDLMSITGFKYIGNGDSMFHVAKGFFGIRLDSVTNTYISVTIDTVANMGDFGSSLAGAYTGPTNGGHFDQDTMIGYTGADTFGILISACKDVYIKDSIIKNISSTNGSIYGININNDSYRCCVSKTNIFGITSDSLLVSELPNKLPHACGYYIDEFSSECYIKKSLCSNIEISNANYILNHFLINNDTSKLIN